MYIHVPLFAHERTSILKYLYVFIKEKISCHSSQTQTLLAFKPINFAVNENANLFVKISCHSSQTQILLAFKPINFAVNENANLYLKKV